MGAVSLFFGDVRFLHHLRCHAGGFRVCGRDEGATKTDECLRSPPRPLRVHTPILLGYRCRTELIRLQSRAYFKLEKHSRKSAKNPPKIAEKMDFSLDKGCFLYYSCIQSANKMHFASANVLTRKDTNAADSKPPTRSCSLWQPSPFSP